MGGRAGYLGEFEQVVLLAVARLSHDAYGMRIRAEIEERGDRKATIGAVYATLDRLEAKGLVTSRLGPGTSVRGGRPKRHYAIQPEGIRALNDAKTAIDRLWAGLKGPLKGTP